MTTKPARIIAPFRDDRSYLVVVILEAMAEEAVISELVSARLFPVLRVNTAKFGDFGL
jgi:hypothetical protein